MASQTEFQIAQAVNELRNPSAQKGCLGKTSQGEVVHENVDNNMKAMHIEENEIHRTIMKSDKSCPKATESAAIVELREHLRQNLLGMERIILFDLWSSDRSTLEAALKRLSDLCTERKNGDATNNRAAFQLVNGWAIILEVMQQWRHDRKIQSLCCLVILNTTDGVDPKYLGRLETIDAIVLAMKTHPTFFPVQLCGCGALTSLCQNKSNVDHLVRNYQGIEIIVKAMQRYRGAKNLQEWARWCLQHILQWEEYRKAFLDVWVRVTLDDALFAEQQRSPQSDPSGFNIASVTSP